MLNKNQLPLLSNSCQAPVITNSQSNKNNSQMSLIEGSSMRQSGTSANLTLNLTKTRITRYQDTSYLQQKTVVPTSLSSLVDDPKLHEYTQQRLKTNFYGTMYRNSQSMTSYKTNFTELDSKDGTLDLNPLLKNVKSSQLQTYLKKIIQQQSDKIQQSSTLPNRQMAIDLQLWFDYMITKVKQSVSLENNNTQTIAEEISLIYSSCLKEIIRQVSLDCKERGQLLEKVWNSYIVLIDDLISNINKTNQEHLEKLKNIQQSQQLNQTQKSYQQDYLTLQQEFQQFKIEKEALDKKNTFLEDRIKKQREEISLLFQKIEQISQEYKKHQNHQPQSTDVVTQLPNGFSNMQLKHLQSIQEGKSIVSHIMTKKAQIPIQLKNKSLSPIQILKTSDDEQSKTPLSQLQLEFDNMEDSQLIKIQKYHRKSNAMQNVILDEKQIQTDKMIFSSIPILNEFIHNFINHGVKAIFDQVKEDEYRESTQIVRCATSISIAQEDFVIETINKSKIKQRVYEELQEYLTKLNDKYIEFQSKNIEQMLIIKEHQVVAQNLEQNLKEATQDFVEILKEKQLTIKSLKHGQTLLLKKINSISQEQLSSKRSPQFPSPTRKTPSFKHTFDFNKEAISKEIDIVKVEEDDDNSSIKSDEKQKVNQTFQINNEVLHLNVLEDQDEYDGQLQGDEKQEINLDTSVYAEDENQLNDQKSEITQSLQLDLQLESKKVDENRLSNVKELIQKFGLQRQSTKKFTKPLQMRVSLLSELKQDKKKVKRIYSQNTDAANSLMKELIAKTPTKKVVRIPIIPIIQLLKIFYTLILDASKNPEGYKIPLHISIYDYFLKKYGFKNVAEKKIKQIFQFICSKMETQPKMQFMARLCYMHGEMDEAIYKQIVETVKYFNNKEVNFHKSDLIIQLDLMTEYCNEFLANFLGQSTVNQYLNSLKHKKEILFESEMITILNLYFSKKKQCEDSLQLIFQAADLDGNQLIEFSEFKTLYKAIHPDLYNKTKALHQFITFADFIDENTKDKMITLDRFAEMAIELNLFNREKINQYGQGSQSLVHEWNENKNLIKYRYLVSNNYHKVKYTFNLLTEQIQLHMQKQNCSHSIQILWVSYKLLFERSQRVILNYELKQLMDDFVPQEFAQITQIYNAIAEINL
ncbi:unnamed protein product [Paramecium octaurelia]|uniref:EF-hand domain-containing protein n=1 Tax=Paramecium octaurelia TaxID=43137 RepID=A0A8S1W4Y6_PAROT|nr:unnamed protein product [Paramecium octaurelia]